MRAIFFYVVKVGLLIAAAVWLANNPGHVMVAWGGWRIDTNLAVLGGVAVAAAIIAVTASALWRLVRRGPKQWRQERGRRKREAGFQAYARGVLALAAGDVETARREAHNTRAFSSDEPLGLLVRAQMATLEGDDASAKDAFRKMLEQPEAELLGLRGLISDALSHGDHNDALGYAERARALAPKLPWAAQALAELHARAGNWDALIDVLEDAERIGALPKADVQRRRAIAMVCLARRAEADGRLEDAFSRAERALALAPGLPAAAVAKARAARLLGRGPKASAALERAWRDCPHPDVAKAYGDLGGDDDPLSKVKRFEKLLKLTPDAAEAHLALAQAAAAARLWGEARNHFQRAAADPLTEGRAALGMADLIEAESHDAVAAADWRRRAALAAPAPRWRCGDCGHETPEWSGRCPTCGAFDSLAWTAAAAGSDAAGASRALAPAATALPGAAP